MGREWEQKGERRGGGRGGGPEAEIAGMRRLCRTKSEMYEVTQCPAPRSELPVRAAGAAIVTGVGPSSQPIREH